jgi:hypothetical protein
MLVKFFCAAPTTISWSPYLLGLFGSDLIHISIQIETVATNLPNEIVLQA